MQRSLTSILIILPFLLHGQATWEQKASAPAGGRFWAAATGNSTHGFAGTGRPEFSALTPLADMYQYERATDTWTAIPDYPAGVREGMTGFTIGERIFFAFGSPFIQFSRTVYEYLPTTGTWVQHPDVPGIGFAFSHGFVIGDTYYIGPENGTNQVYAFNGTTNTWSTVAPFPGNDRRAQCAFSANGKGYLGMGAGVFSGVYGDWWEYDPVADAWNAVADIFPNSDQSTATAVGDVGFVFNVGGSGGGGKQLYRYNATADEWIQDALLPTDRIANGSLFSVGDKGYLVFGEKSLSGGNLPSNELWQFTPGTTGLAEEVDAFGLVAFGGADGVITVRSTRPMDALATVRLLDASGAVLSEINAHGPLNMRIGSDLPSGVYLVQVSSAVAAHALRVAVVR